MVLVRLEVMVKKLIVIVAWIYGVLQSYQAFCCVLCKPFTLQRYSLSTHKGSEALVLYVTCPGSNMEVLSPGSLSPGSLSLTTRPSTLPCYLWMSWGDREPLSSDIHHQAAAVSFGLPWMQCSPHPLHQTWGLGHCGVCWILKRNIGCCFSYRFLRKWCQGTLCLSYQCNANFHARILISIFYFNKLIQPI